MNESKHWEDQGSAVSIPSATTSSGSINEAIAATTRGISKFLGLLFSTLSFLLLNPISGFISWALLLFLAISTIFNNYKNTRPAVENYKAWGLWLISVIVAIVLMYVYRSKKSQKKGTRSPDRSPPHTPDPPNPNLFNIFFMVLLLRGKLLLAISMLVAIAALIYSMQYYFASKEFKLYRAQVEQPPVSG